MAPGVKGLTAPKDWALNALDTEDEYEQDFAGFFGGYAASVSILLWDCLVSAVLCCVEVCRFVAAFMAATRIPYFRCATFVSCLSPSPRSPSPPPPPSSLACMGPGPTIKTSTINSFEARHS